MALSLDTERSCVGSQRSRESRTRETPNRAGLCSRHQRRLAAQDGIELACPDSPEARARDTPAPASGSRAGARRRTLPRTTPGSRPTRRDRRAASGPAAALRSRHGARDVVIRHDQISLACSRASIHASRSPDRRAACWSPGALTTRHSSPELQSRANSSSPSDSPSSGRADSQITRSPEIAGARAGAPGDDSRTGTLRSSEIGRNSTTSLPSLAAHLEAQQVRPVLACGDVPARELAVAGRAAARRAAAGRSARGRTRIPPRATPRRSDRSPRRGSPPSRPAARSRPRAAGC